jgi:hypothetical protein
MKARYYLSLLVSLVSFKLSAQPAPSPSPGGVFTPNIRPELRIQRLTGEIAIDGELNEPAWQQAERAKNFAEAYPLEKIKPLSETEAMLTYDDKYLYVAIIAQDDPKEIRHHLTARDNIWQDDWMGLIVDPYGDAVRAYEFYVNPEGIQGDLLWTDNDDDANYDMLWTSEAKITATGWQIEMRIPFKSLRFPDKEVQDWRITFWRQHPRNDRHKYTWAALDRNDPCTFCQFGNLTGLEGVKSGNQLELLPAFVTSQASRRESDRLVSEDIKAEFSLGARYALSQSTSVEATYNPDFSQIESDATQINLNSSTALFYPERRPFFREGYDLFDTWIDAVYTRSINDPKIAAKVLNRSGSTNFAFLSAVDERTSILIPFEERSDFIQLGRSYANILRGTHSFDGNNTIGLLATDKRLEHSGSNTVYGGDAKVQLYENLMMEAQLLGSDTRGMEDSSWFNGSLPEGALGGANKAGYATYLSFERFSRTLDFDLDLAQRSPSFRAVNGFISNTDNEWINLWSGYKFPIDSSPVFVEIRPNVALGRKWNFDGERKDEWVTPALNMTLKGQTEIGMDYMYSRETYQGIYFPGIRRGQVWGNTNFSDVVSFGAFASVGKLIARNLEVPELGFEQYYEVYGTIKPFSNFSVAPNFKYDKLDHESGENIYAISIFRTRFDYQVNREFSLRVVLEYNDYDRSLSFQPLLTYRINPFSVFYLGSSHGYESFGHQRFLDKIEFQRQIFAKIQYLFQV